MFSQDNIIVTGFAQLPKGTTLYERNKIVGCVLVINYKKRIIEDAEFTFVADLTNFYLSSMLKGYEMKNGILPIINLVKKHCLIPSQGAIIQAIRSAWDRFEESNPI